MSNVDEYIPMRELRKIIKLEYRAAKRFGENSGIKTINTPSGQTLYSKQDLIKYVDPSRNIQEVTESKPKKNYVYCRVSSKKQENDLQRQLELARTEYPNHTIVSDIGSGINWKRKNLKTILEQSMQGNVESVTVFHRDRLARFAFELIEFIFNANNTKLIVIDKDDSKSSEQELTEDLLSIVHIYSCKQMGKRRYTKKSNDVKSETNQNLSNNNTEETTKEMV